MEKNELLMQLISGCYGTEEMVYQKPIDGEEKQELQNQFIENCKKHASLQDQFKKMQDEFKKKMKPLEDLKKEQLSILRTGSIEVEGTLYMFDDQDARQMIYKDPSGQVITSRPLTAKERQLNFVSEQNKAAV